MGKRRTDAELLQLTPGALVEYAEGVFLMVRSLEGKELRDGAIASLGVSVDTARLAVEMARYKQEERRR